MLPTDYVNGQSPPNGSVNPQDLHPSDKQALADAVGEQMFADDPATKHLGIQLVSIGPGRANMQMVVQAFMANGHGTCHGGYLFLFADSAFAFACNSHGQRAVAAGASIDFIAPAQVADTLTASAMMLNQSGRSGLYDINVHNQQGQLIAVFRGQSATIKGSFSI